MSSIVSYLTYPLELAAKKTHADEAYFIWKNLSWGERITPLYGVTIFPKTLHNILDNALKVSSYFGKTLSQAETYFLGYSSVTKVFYFLNDLPAVIKMLPEVIHFQNIPKFLKLALRITEKGIGALGAVGKGCELLAETPIKWITSWLSAFADVMGIFRCGKYIYENQGKEVDQEDKIEYFKRMNYNSPVTRVLKEYRKTVYGKVFFSYLRIVRNVLLLLLTIGPWLTATSGVAAVLLLQGIGFLLVRYSYYYIKSVLKTSPLSSLGTSAATDKAQLPPQVITTGVGQESSTSSQSEAVV